VQVAETAPRAQIFFAVTSAQRARIIDCKFQRHGKTETTRQLAVRVNGSQCDEHSHAVAATARSPSGAQAPPLAAFTEEATGTIPRQSPAMRTVITPRGLTDCD